MSKRIANKRHLRKTPPRSKVRYGWRKREARLRAQMDNEKEDS